MAAEDTQCQSLVTTCMHTYMHKHLPTCAHTICKHKLGDVQFYEIGGRWEKDEERWEQGQQGWRREAAVRRAPETFPLNLWAVTTVTVQGLPEPGLWSGKPMFSSLMELIPQPLKPRLTVLEAQLQHSREICLSFRCLRFFISNSMNCEG